MDDDDSQHLFSIVVTVCTITLLYLPTPLSFFSPILVAAIALFLILLRSTTTQKTDPNPQSETSDDRIGELDTKLGDGVGSKSDLGYKFDDSFLKWDVGAPLDVIYEEESESEFDDEEREATSLYRCFPESDSDTTSSEEYPDWESSTEKSCFKWDEDDAYGLIEISLDNKKVSDFGEEDIMFEIDISPASCSRIPAS